MNGSLNDVKKGLLGDVSNNKAFRIGTYVVLGVVAAVMTILNIKTEKGYLTWCTGVFAGLCIINILLTLVSEITSRIARTLFALEVLCMFTFFLISGNPDGFSAIWICMLPSLGMFFFDRFRGTVLCAGMFLILVFFLWIPYGQSLLMYDYTDTFKMRFPVLFVAFHMLAFLLETLRVNAYKELRRLSVRDQLTGVLNRQGMYAALETEEQYRTAHTIGAAILDVDFFKEVNDRYGHNAGDVVLKEFAALVEKVLKVPVCRWGGEEFVVVFTDGALREADFCRMKEQVEQHVFLAEEQPIRVTASIGVCVSENAGIDDVDALIGKADEALYEAKSTGRNKIVYSKAEPEA